LLAPIALYPDEVLTQALIAATYPLEVVQATRFVQQNPELSGEPLDQALVEKNWDPSVQSLAAFPQVLAMMSDNLEWTQRLGDAFLTDEQRVMETVQGLRRRAQTTGNLQSTPKQAIFQRDNEIVIEPSQPDVIYVPVYNPFYVYGPWWAPDYPPWFWYPPPIYGYPLGAMITTGLFFGAARAVSHHHWGWAHADWHHHHVNVDPDHNRFWNRPGHPPPSPGGIWQHAPEHRRGIAYPNAATRDRFIAVDPNAVRLRRDFRGYDVAPRSPNVAPANPNVRRPAPNLAQPVPSVPQVPRTFQRPAPTLVQPSPGSPQLSRPLPRPVAPHFDPNVSRQQAEASAQRGMQSRQSIGPPPAAVGRPTPQAGTPQHSGRQR
jgi:hypothetical protein